MQTADRVLRGETLAKLIEGHDKICWYPLCTAGWGTISKDEDYYFL